MRHRRIGLLTPSVWCLVGVGVAASELWWGRERWGAAAWYPIVVGSVGAAAILVITAVGFEFLTGGPRGSRRNAVVFGGFSMFSLVGGVAFARYHLAGSLICFSMGLTAGWAALGVCFRWPGFRTAGPIEDPELGWIYYRPPGSWESHASPPGCPCAVRLSGSPAGPFALQRKALRRVVRDFARVEALARAFVDRHREDRTPIEAYTLDVSAARDAADGRFTLDYIDLENLVVHRVIFVGWEPREYELRE